MTALSRELNERHFATIIGVDQGTEVNPKMEAIYNIIIKMNRSQEASGEYFQIDIDSETEMQLLLGAQINLGESKDFMVTPTLDLAYASFSSAGYADVVDYFKAMTIDYYRYAKQAA